VINYTHFLHPILIAGPQVSDPAAKEFAREVALHMGWWQEIWQRQKGKGLSECWVCPEFGPAPYLPALPHTQVLCIYCLLELSAVRFSVRQWWLVLHAAYLPQSGGGGGRIYLLLESALLILSSHSPPHWPRTTRAGARGGSSGSRRRLQGALAGGTPTNALALVAAEVRGGLVVVRGRWDVNTLAGGVGLAVLLRLRV